MAGKEFVERKFNFDAFNRSWIDLFTKVHEERGSWPVKNVKRWHLEEI